MFISILTIILALVSPFTSAPDSELPEGMTYSYTEELAYPLCPDSVCMTDSPELQSDAFYALESNGTLGGIEVPYGHSIETTLIGYIDTLDYPEPTEDYIYHATLSDGTTYIFSVFVVEDFAYHA